MTKSKNLYEVYAKEIGKYSTLDKETEKDLSTKILQSGDKDAFMKLITSNLKLVVYITYEMYDNRYGLDFLDMVSEGNLALMEAATMWDWKKDSKRLGFGVFASVIIRRAIMRHIYAEGRLVSYPVKDLTEKKRVRKAEEVFEQRYNRPPSEEELACLTGLNERVIRLIHQCDLPTISLDLPEIESNPEEDLLAARIDTLQFDIDNSDLGCIQVFCAPERMKDVNDTIESIVTLLPDIHKEVLFYAYGIQGHPVLSTEEIAATLGKTVRRVNQLKREALRRLKLSNAIQRFDMLKSKS